MKVFISVALVVAAVLDASYGSSVVINSIEDVRTAVMFDNITISNLTVPAGKTLKLKLLPGTNLVFNGTINFGYKPWNGSLIKISGSNVNITGTPTNLLNGNGKKWWDGKGTQGGKLKPAFMELKLNYSTVSGLIIKNTPAKAISIKYSEDLTLNGIVIDNRAAAKGVARDTHGITVSKSESVEIKNTIVYTQGNCFNAASGSGITLQHVACVGGAGVKMGTVGENGNNHLENVSVRNCVIQRTKYGIRFRLSNGGAGRINNVNLQNIVLDDIRKGGIVMNEGNSSNVTATGSVPVTNLRVKDVRGNVLEGGMNINILAKNASQWSWDSDITGGTLKTNCSGIEKGSGYCM